MSLFQSVIVCLLVVGLSMQGCFATTPGKVTTVAVAANFLHPMKQLKTDFEKAFPHRLKIVYGSSGKLFAQIVQGAPFDVFLSADQVKPQQLQKLNLTLQSGTYAIGQLALVSVIPEINLHHGDFFKTTRQFSLAIANPKFAPYGQAAITALANLSVDLTDQRILMADNVAQAIQFALTGNADAAIVAYSQLHAINNNHPQMTLNYWLIPSHFHQAIKQNAVLLKKAKDNMAAAAFYQYLLADSTQEKIIAMGYITDHINE